LVSDSLLGKDSFR